MSSSSQRAESRENREQETGAESPPGENQAKEAHSRPVLRYARRSESSSISKVLARRWLGRQERRKRLTPAESS